MGGASRLKMLLSSPFIIYHPTPALRLIRISASTLSSTSSSKTAIKFLSNTSTIHRPFLLLTNNSFHTHSAATRDGDEDFSVSSHPHPWPEWSSFVDNLRANGFFFDGHPQLNVNGEDALSVLDHLPQHFLAAATAALSFARQRPHLLGSLSRTDIQLLVENGSPFLFQTAVDTATRMKSFLGNNQSTELGFQKASMVDLMRFLVSYVYNATVSDRNKLSSGQLVESSVRNLLRELAYETRVVHNPSLSSSEPRQFPDGYAQNSRPLRQNIEMKRGDWICSKCSFMNFARNMNCLECDEARPKRQLTGGEWNCPQCDFFNYGKNVVCLRCDCKRPGEVSTPAGPRFGFERSNENMANTFNIQRANLEPRTTNAGTSGASVSRNLDRILGRTSEESKSDYVPFNPLPSDMFNRNQNSNAEEDQVRGSNKFSASTRNEASSFDKPRDSSPFSRKPVNQTESKEDKEQAEKSERWFKKVAELHDVTDLPSAISDEDFPEIMPMRKGENRFVVSKKKDRSLTSPPHKRRVAMEPATNGTNFVPFVPFPPDYFAKKNKVPETETSTVKDASGTSASAAPETPDVVAERSSGVIDSGTFSRSTQTSENEQRRTESWDTSFPGKNSSESRVDYSYGRPSGSSTHVSESGQSRKESWGTSFSGKNSSESGVDYSYGRPSASSSVVPTDFRTGSRESRSGASWENSGSTGNSTQQSESGHNTKESWRAGFSGKSLEGSLVKEPDPLDMSEEAKAERWFRRVAQIKDISELSQIPDEDFPQIMPMRKGVNRFVVSKRKTPLERRLTSPQYRRNLPTVSSEPVNKENTES